MKLAYVVKRAFDYAAASGGLVVASPLMLAIAAAIKLDTPGGVLFVQERLGREGKPFKLLKFRTMKNAPVRYNPDGSTKIDRADDRVTRVGRYLRGALDELPQLVNVLRGEMSIIGPRPDMVHQRELYQPGEERKLEVLPGLTGLSVVLGRNDIPWKQRIQIDIHYIDHWSLWLDFRIFTQTLAMAAGRSVFRFEDVDR